MKYEFSFTEINYGSIEIESKTTPTKDEVISAIMSGNAYIKDSEYTDIRLSGTTKEKSRSNREFSR
jgi:hypothetical protein